MRRPALAVLLSVLTGIAPAHESPVDHVEREFRLWVEAGRLHMAYRVQHSERSVLMQLRKMDTDNDGIISSDERDSSFTVESAKLASLFNLILDGKPLKLVPSGPVRCDARLGQTYTFVADLPVMAPGRHTGRMEDGHARSYPGPFRWLADDEKRGRGTVIRPLTPAGERTSALHSASLVLDFEAVVPE